MAETVKHTPGPWEFDDDNGVIAQVGAHICTVSMADDFPCIDNDEDENERINVDAECTANARLIAAAPDLLAMLKVAQLWLDVDGRFDMQGINAAIAKAEGGAS